MTIHDCKSLARDTQETKKVLNKPFTTTSDLPCFTKKGNCNNNNKRNNEENTTNQGINPRKRNQKLSYLQVIYTNADSLMNKRNELIERVNTEKPHVAVITEVNPKNQRYATTKQELALDGYSVFTNAEENGVRGVAIFVKNHLNPVESRRIRTSGVHEAVAVEIKLRGGDKQLILAVYRSPNSTPESNNKLNDMIRGLNCSGYSHILLLGDFNFPDVEWSGGGALGNYSPCATPFVDAINDAFLFQHVEFPTRYRDNQSSNVLDLVFTNEDDMIEEITDSAPLGKSDHIVIKIKLRCYIEVADIVKWSYMYGKADIEKIRQCMQCDWDAIFMNKSVEEKWQLFRDRMIDAMKNHIPMKKSTPADHRRPLWLNRGTVRTIRRKHKAWTRLQEARTAENNKRYARARNQARWATRKSIKAFEKSVAQNIKTNPKLFWKYVHSKTKTRQPISDLQKEDGSLTVNDHEKAEVLNQFFTSVFTKEDLSNMPTVEKHQVPKDLDSIYITVEEVQKGLSRLKTCKSPGPDGLHPLVLKELSDTIAHPLMRLFQASLDEGILPRDWRLAHVSPIYKKRTQNRSRQLSASECNISIV